MAQGLINPFCPGNPVPPGVFAGRRRQLNEISACICQSAVLNPQNILITGERGIGKTSIAMAAKSIAEQKQVEQQELPDHPFVVVSLSVQEGTPSEIVIAQLVHDLSLKIQPTQAATKIIFDKFIKQFSELKLFGSGYTARDKSPDAQQVYLEAGKCIRVLAQNLKDQSKLLKSKGESMAPQAICVIIDELDKMGDFEKFSSFWKVTQEKLAYDDCRNLILVLAGMPVIVNRLTESHESFLRTFTPVSLSKMPKDEAEQIIYKALKKGRPLKSISQPAVNKILFYSENYPHLIQELGHSAFRISTTNEISPQDVEAGLYGNNNFEGSIEKLGKLFFSKMYNEIRKNQNYKEVLKTVAHLAGAENNWVPRQNMLEQNRAGTEGMEPIHKKTSLDRGLHDLSNRDLILKNPDKAGEYRMYSKMFQVYINKILPK